MKRVFERNPGKNAPQPQALEGRQSVSPSALPPFQGLGLLTSMTRVCTHFVRFTLGYALSPHSGLKGKNRLLQTGHVSGKTEGQKRKASGLLSFTDHYS